MATCGRYPEGNPDVSGGDKTAPAKVWSPERFDTEGTDLDLIGEAHGDLVASQSVVGTVTADLLGQGDWSGSPSSTSDRSPTPGSPSCSGAASTCSSGTSTARCCASSERPPGTTVVTTRR